MECLEQTEKIKTDFSQSRKMLLAIGDETRQSIITALMGIGYGGLRVGEITATEEGVYTTCSACQESHAATQIVSV